MNKNRLLTTQQAAFRLHGDPRTVQRLGENRHLHKASKGMWYQDEVEFTVKVYPYGGYWYYNKGTYTPSSLAAYLLRYTRQNTNRLVRNRTLIGTLDNNTRYIELDKNTQSDESIPDK